MIACGCLAIDFFIFCEKTFQSNIFCEKTFCSGNLLSEDVLRKISSGRRRSGIEKDLWWE